jgi:hexosaminidase
LEGLGAIAGLQENRLMTPHLSMIPLPAKSRLTGSSLKLSRDFPIYVPTNTPAMLEVVETFLGMVKPTANLQPRIVDHDARGHAGLSVSLVPTNAEQDKESYTLSVAEKGVSVSAGTTVGLFYGLLIFGQMLPTDDSQGGELAIPCLEIGDRPRFCWRGMHLDVSRHFPPAEFIKKYIDLLARHKMNVFHWHLTDDQGWRIEIKRYPLLTEVGAWRKEADGRVYGGFYTQQEIREIVEYARRRFITVVPEIELPGHASAALAAYPEYSCAGGPFEVATEWGVFDDVYCAGKEATFKFLEDVLTEVAELFPGQYIHIGGDECPKARWNSHELCQERMRAEGLANADELQAYFIFRIARHLRSLGKRLVGWDEILDGGAPEGATIMAWRNAQKGTEAAQSGHDVVMTPMSHCYFDHYQAKKNEPKAIGGFTPLERVYSFEPAPTDLPRELTRHVLGAQGNVWTEYMPDTNHMEYMVFPRLCALSEVLWSPQESHSLADFLDRLKLHLKRLDRLHVNYRRMTE